MGNELLPFCELHPVSCSVQGGPGVDGCKLLDLFLCASEKTWINLACRQRHSGLIGSICMSEVSNLY